MKESFTVSPVDEKELAAELPGANFSIAEKIAARLAKSGIIVSGINGRTVAIEVHRGLIEDTRESVERHGLLMYKSAMNTDEVT